MLVVAIPRGIREVGLVALATGIVISGLQRHHAVGPAGLAHRHLPPLVGLVFLAVVMRFWRSPALSEPTAPTLEELSAQDEPMHPGWKL